MTKLDRLLRAGIDPGVAQALAALPGAQVDLICKGARSAGRAAIKRDKERRAYARQHRSARWTDADQVADGSRRMLRGLSLRAASRGDLEAGALLYRLIMSDGYALLQATVDGLRADTPERKGYTDQEIATAFGVSKWAIGKRFGLRRDTPGLVAAATGTDTEA
jgi:hypothetical protein